MEKLTNGGYKSMEKLTRKEAKRLMQEYGVIAFGGYYCSKQKYTQLCNTYGVNYELVKIGYNCGIYGLNWSLYHDVINGVMIIDSYRNTPNITYIEESELHRFLETLRG